MAIITKLSKKDFEEILLKYDIGKYKAHTHISHALQNTVFVLNTTKGKYVLKIFEESEADFIKFQIKVIEYLSNKNIPVARVLALKNKQKLLIYKNKKITIQKFSAGGPPKKIIGNLIKDLARNLGLMNRYLLKLKLKGSHDWEKDHEFIPNPSVKNILGINFRAHEKNLLKDINKLDRRKLRRSIIHSDFRRANVFVAGNKLKVIIDWDDAHEDYLSYEVAVFLMDSFASTKAEASRKNIKLFFGEYQKYLDLNDEEKKAIYYFIKQRLLSVIFWHKRQIKAHKDLKNKLEKQMEKIIKNYLAFNKISLDEFLELT